MNIEIESIIITYQMNFPQEKNKQIFKLQKIILYGKKSSNNKNNIRI